MGTNTGWIVEAKGLCRTYRQGSVDVHALRGVDLTVERGEFSVLAGPSGSGKTTLLNQVGALDTPSSGTLEVDGHSLLGLSRTAAARFRLQHIGFVFQAYNLMPVLTAYENAEFVLALRGVSAQERRALVWPLLERTGLAALANRRPAELSGGQQQRVAVVRALAARPALVLADEPTANLDSKTACELLDLMGELNAELGTTFLFSSHDAHVIERARRVVRLDSGTVVADERRGSTPASAPAPAPSAASQPAEALVP